MDELIRKQDALDAICMEWCDCKHKDCKLVFDPEHDDDYFCDGCRDTEIIKALSAAPKDKSYELWKESFMEMKRRYDVLVERTKESVRQNQNAAPGKMVGDCISRKAAIDALTTYIYNVYKAMTGESMLTDKCRQAAESVIGEFPIVQPETCEGCKHLGKWENEVEYGYPSPCTRCKRRVEDHYER